MVIVNLWFIPRSRSTALLRCLSNIPGSKVFFEKLTFCDFVNNFPHIFEEGKVSDDQPLETYEDVLKAVLNNSSPIKIVKDIAGTLKTDDYPKLMTKESVNIFAFRHPALVETSVITGHAIPYFEVNKRAGFPVKMNEAYESMLEMIKYVKQNCDHEPVVLPGEILCSKEKTIEAVKKIFSLIGIDFDKKYLTWESLDLLDPTWDSFSLARESQNSLGFFERANKSTQFEDSVERDVDIETLSKVKPEIAESVKKLTPTYQSIMGTVSKN
ncbi:uncharacterized protein LOC134855484 [Symsagittifera roscoffensis]|uniref:uncharacterized protein LOC134855484 n=1 Tax=Symsagittifera roscoffensis TaxID=84072 RepID=UPI00307BBB31